MKYFSLSNKNQERRLPRMENKKKSRRRPQPIPVRPYRLLLPLNNLEEARLLLPLAEMIVSARQGQLLIVNVLGVPEDRSLSESAKEASKFREALGTLLYETIGITAQLKSLVRFENELIEGIWELARQEDVDLVLLGWANDNLPETALGGLDDARMADPPCHIVAVRPSIDILGGEGWQAVKNILLPVRGGFHSTLTLRFANTLARYVKAEITLLHVSPEGEVEDENQFKTEFSPVIQSLGSVTRSITTKGSISRAIVKETRDHQILVMGSPNVPGESETWSSPLLDPVLQGTTATLVVVKEHRPLTPAPYTREEPATIQIDRPVAVVVDNWFAENTYHSREFANLERLVVLKEQQGLSISLGLPALNEEETVGNVIQTVKKSLMDDIPLLDEIILIDSGSIDYTREIASDLGIPVFIHQEILPEQGAYRGKGEALWKSLHVLSGDIIAWIDTDISNIHPRFVYGIIGPLLRDKHVQYVKGFYRRPLMRGDKPIAGSGGRVTELTARPFFNLFFPELSGLIQPLSGEYAGRRSALERMPFFTGYGVETGLLIDILERYGLSGIAQVDLLERIHHSQPLPSLSKMSFSIMQVVFKRLEKRHNTRLLEHSNLTMNLIRFGQQRGYSLEPEEIQELERPPMRSILEYRRKRGLSVEKPVPPGPTAEEVNRKE
jgi:hypothetical protein